MTTSIVIAIIFTILACSSLRTQGAAIEQNDFEAVNFGTALKSYYEAIRHIMPCGLAEWKVPVLAPYKVNKIELDIGDENTSLKGEITNMEVIGLNHFRLLESSFNPSNGKVKIDMFIPEIRMLAEYNNANVSSLFGLPVHLSGEGVIDIKLLDHRAVSEFTLAPRANSSTLEISNPKVHSRYGDIVFNNWNNYWDVSTNNFVNRVSQETALFLSKKLQGPLNEFISATYVPLVNEALTSVNMNQLVNWMVVASDELNNVKC